MASQDATRLKAEMADMPDECFETLTFGELRPLDRFIVFPLPGDNSGHGGYRGGHYLFCKVAETVSEVAYAIPHGIARNGHTGTHCHFPHDMRVLKVV